MAFYVFGSHAAIIREGRLYRSMCKTWDEFCRSVLGETPNAVGRKIRGVAIINKLKSIASRYDLDCTMLPRSESQTRPLALIKDEVMMFKVWQLACSLKAPGFWPTRADIMRAVRSFRATPLIPTMRPCENSQNRSLPPANILEMLRRCTIVQSSKRGTGNGKEILGIPRYWIACLRICESCSAVLSIRCPVKVGRWRMATYRLRRWYEQRTLACSATDRDLCPNRTRNRKKSGHFARLIHNTARETALAAATGQTVNLLAYAFSGSNPLLPILRHLASSATSDFARFESLKNQSYLVASSDKSYGKQSFSKPSASTTSNGRKICPSRCGPEFTREAWSLFSASAVRKPLAS